MNALGYECKVTDAKLVNNWLDDKLNINKEENSLYVLLINTDQSLLLIIGIHIQLR